MVLFHQLARRIIQQLPRFLYGPDDKEEFKASFSLAGDARLAAGITVLVSGYGAVDGKYIIETATHSVSRSGYKTDITLRRVLEDY